MATLVMMKGLPCSGKTTWANEWVRQKRNRVRVSWSDILSQMGGGWRRDKLPFAVDAAVRLMCQALASDYDVVLDEENLMPGRFGIFMARALMLKAKVVWHTMDTPLDECLRRNALKEHPATDLVIQRKAERWAVWLRQK